MRIEYASCAHQARLAHTGMARGEVFARWRGGWGFDMHRRALGHRVQNSSRGSVLKKPLLQRQPVFPTLARMLPASQYVGSHASHFCDTPFCSQCFTALARVRLLLTERSPLQRLHVPGCVEIGYQLQGGAGRLKKTLGFLGSI